MKFKSIIYISIFLIILSPVFSAKFVLQSSPSLVCALIVDDVRVHTTNGVNESIYDIHNIFDFSYQANIYSISELNDYALIDKYSITWWFNNRNDNFIDNDNNDFNYNYNELPPYGNCGWYNDSIDFDNDCTTNSNDIDNSVGLPAFIYSCTLDCDNGKQNVLTNYNDYYACSGLNYNSATNDNDDLSLACASLGYSNLYNYYVIHTDYTGIDIPSSDLKIRTGYITGVEKNSQCRYSVNNVYTPTLKCTVSRNENYRDQNSTNKNWLWSDIFEYAPDTKDKTIDMSCAINIVIDGKAPSIPVLPGGNNGSGSYPPGINPGNYTSNNISFDPASGDNDGTPDNGDVNKPLELQKQDYINVQKYQINRKMQFLDGVVQILDMIMSLIYLGYYIIILIIAGTFLFIWVPNLFKQMVENYKKMFKVK